MVKSKISILECLLFGNRLILSIYHVDGVHLLTYITKTGVVKTRVIDCFLNDTPCWVDIKL